MSTRIGVDIGGTFSDLIYLDERTGEVVAAKGPSTPHAPEEGVAALLRSAVPPAVARAARYFLHGSTVALNSLIERKGARVGLVTTAGFRDVLELRRGERDALNDATWRAPEPLVPRALRLEVRERVFADGTVDVPLALEDVDAAAAAFAAATVDSVAVVLLNAFVDPAHELAVERQLRAAGFAGEIALSHRVSGEYREYERTSTTVIDAYVRPPMRTYLARLEAALHEAGFAGDCVIMTSGGGGLHFGDARERPFQTIQSGPAAGAVGAGDLATALGLPLVVTADVGGTSFDTCLVRDGRPEVRFEGRVEGMPLQAPWIDVRSIGAGGGSIARIDAGGLLRVGPESAGASPGPACYGRGGTEPTVTDAACLLGMLSAGELASGLALDPAAAAAAIEPLARGLGRAPAEVARGILAIASGAMANAIREVTMEQGYDPREAALLAFGGAGPLFGTLLADALRIPKVLVPRFAGNFSAWGLLWQDVVQSAASTLVRPLHGGGLEAARAELARLHAALRGRARAGTAPAAVDEAALDLRYEGQEYTLTIPLDGASAPEVERAFHDAYGRAFGHELDEAVEIVSVRAFVRTPLPGAIGGGTANGHAAPPRSVKAYSFTAGAWARFAVHDRAALAPGDLVAGPAIVLEETATTYVDGGFSTTVDPSGTLVIAR